MLRRATYLRGGVLLWICVLALEQLCVTWPSLVQYDEAFNCNMSAARPLSLNASSCLLIVHASSTSFCEPMLYCLDMSTNCIPRTNSLWYSVVILLTCHVPIEQQIRVVILHWFLLRFAGTNFRFCYSVISSISQLLLFDDRLSCSRLILSTLLEITVHLVSPSFILLYWRTLNHFLNSN